MSANPHNPSLGLPDEGSPGNRLPDDRLTDGGSIARKRGALFYSPPGPPARYFNSLYRTRRDTKLYRLCWRFPACMSRYASAAPSSGAANRWSADVWELEQFVLDEVLQLVAERALTLTGADGVAVAMAEGRCHRLPGCGRNCGACARGPPGPEIRFFRSLPAQRRNRALRRHRKRSAGECAGLPPPGYPLHRGRADRLHAWHAWV